MSKVSEQKDTVARVHQDRAGAHRTFKEKWRQMDDNSKFLRLNQYSTKQLQKMDKEKRVPYVLDHVNASLNTLMGIQRDMRTDIFYYPTENKSALKTEVLNAVKDSILRQNNFIYLESDLFKDGIIEKLGALGYEWSKERDKNGTLKIFRIPPRQLMWDLNAVEFTKSDAMWVSRHRMFSKKELSERHPEMRKYIQKMDVTADELYDLGVRGDYVNQMMDTENGWVGLVEHFDRLYESRFFIQNTSSGILYDKYYDTEKDAAEEIRDILQKEAAKFTERGQVPPAPEYFKVTVDKYPVVRKTELAHDQLFSEETIDEPFIPIDFYHPLWHDGDWWCPLDILKDGQRYFNKTFSALDHWIGTMSKGLILASGNAPKDEVTQVKNAFASTGGVIQVRDPESYKEIKSQGPAPQLFSMVELAEANMSDNSGGRNRMGKKETASESGVAIRTRIQQGGLSGFIFYDNLRRTKLSVGEKVAWYLTTYLTMPRVVRIEGEELVQQTIEQLGSEWFQTNKLRPGIGFLEINTVEHNTIENLKVDVIVDESKWSISKNQSILQELNTAMQSNPGLANLFPPEVILEFLPLPFSLKEQTKIRMKQLEEKQNQLEMAKAVKPPTVTASLGDVIKLGGAAMVQFMAKYFGIQVDPSSVPDENAHKAMIDIAKAKADIQIKSESHAQDMEHKQQEAEMNQGNALHKMFFNHLTGEQKLSHAEQLQEIKTKRNGDAGE